MFKNDASISENPIAQLVVGMLKEQALDNINNTKFVVDLILNVGIDDIPEGAMKEAIICARKVINTEIGHVQQAMRNIVDRPTHELLR